LIHAAVHLSLKTSQPVDSGLLHRQGEFLRLLKQRLDDPNETTSESTDGSNRNMTSDVKSDLVHRIAITKMVELRYVLHNLGWNGVLAMFVSIGDLLSATTSNSKPYMDYPFTNSTLTVLDLVYQYIQPSKTPFDSVSFAAEIKCMIKVVGRLTPILSHPAQYPCSSIGDIVSLNQLCYAIEHRLLSAEVPDEERSSEEQANVYLLKAARLVILTSANHSLRKFSRQIALFRSLYKNLMQPILRLESLSSLSQDEYSLRPLLWTCWWGEMASAERNKFFVPRIKVYLWILGYTTLDEIYSCLSSFV
jgi:hypothetical protein